MLDTLLWWYVTTVIYTMVICCYGDMLLWWYVAMAQCCYGYMWLCWWCTKEPRSMEGVIIQRILGPRCQLRRQNQLVFRSAYTGCLRQSCVENKLLTFFEGRNDAHVHWQLFTSGPSQWTRVSCCLPSWCPVRLHLSRTCAPCPSICASSYRVLLSRKRTAGGERHGGKTVVA